MFAVVVVALARVEGNINNQIERDEIPEPKSHQATWDY